MTLELDKIHAIQKDGYWCEPSGRGYYRIECQMPLPLAEEMYYETGDLGRYHIRVSGHCGCPPPHHWSKGSLKQPYVDSYHIDSDEGLALFKLYAEASKSWKWNPTYIPYELTADIRKAYTKRVMGDKYEPWLIK